MKNRHEMRLKNAEFNYCGEIDAKGLDLLRDCIKTVLDERRTAQSKETSTPKRRLKKPTKGAQCNDKATKNSG